jgi:hypothetical protein
MGVALTEELPYVEQIKSTCNFSAAVFTAAVSLSAEEGMWTFDNPSVKQLQDHYGFQPTQACKRLSHEWNSGPTQDDLLWSL